MAERFIFTINRLSKLQTDGWRNNSAYHREPNCIRLVARKPISKLSYFANYTWLTAYIQVPSTKTTTKNQGGVHGAA
jgi:hypothetical protein